MGCRVLLESPCLHPAAVILLEQTQLFALYALCGRLGHQGLVSMFI